MAPKLPALTRTQISSAAAITNMNGAPKACSLRMDSTPRQTTTILRSQKPRKHAHKMPRLPAAPGQITMSMASMALPPIHDWMPNHPQATTARSSAARCAAHAKRRAQKHGKRNAVFRARVRVQQQGNQHDQVAEQHRADGLLPIHAVGDESRREAIGRDFHAHGK